MEIQVTKTEDSYCRITGNTSEVNSTHIRNFIILLQSHLWLLTLGITSEIVYCCYLLHTFPVTVYSYRLDTMGGIAGYTHTGFLIYLMAFSVLFVLFGFAWWETHEFQDCATLWIILSFGAVFALTTMFVYPVTAIDIFNYIVYALLLVQYHVNPMITSPSQFRTDSLMGFAGGFINQPSPYGPLGQLIQALPVAIGGRNVLASLLLLKLMFSAMLVISAFFIYTILAQVAPKFALPSTLALAWNPFALFEFSANGHNDIVMMLLIILAVLALVKEHHVWALMLITASALIKFASLSLIPLFFFYSCFHQPIWQKCTIYILKASICSAVLAFICFAPFWAGPQTFARFFSEIGYQLYSFSNFLPDSSAGRISPQQANVIGWFLFANCFLYALWLSSKDYVGLLKGCYITMFALLAFSATYVQPWYLIWPFIFALLIPQIGVSFAAILLTYGAILAELGLAYLFPWGPTQAASTVISSCLYFIMFFPSTLFLLVFRFKRTFSRSSKQSNKISR
jgi:hypothetical protein